MIRAIVVEDEPLARDYLVSLLGETGGVQVVGQAEDAASALRLFERHPAEVAFVDIRLPGPDGLTLGAALARFPQPPLLVFVTGHAEYAVDAYQVHPADYLLKPLEPDRVAETVVHLQQRLEERQMAGSTAEPEPEPELLPVRDRARDLARLLARHEIVAVLRRGRRTWIHTTEAEYSMYQPVADLEEWLGGKPFFRAARDAIVNLTYVQEILHFGDRLYRLRLMDREGTVVEVSRSSASELATILRCRL